MKNCFDLEYHGLTTGGYVCKKSNHPIVHVLFLKMLSLPVYVQVLLMGFNTTQSTVSMTIIFFRSIPGRNMYEHIEQVAQTTMYKKMRNCVAIQTCFCRTFGVSVTDQRATRNELSTDGPP